MSVTALTDGTTGSAAAATLTEDSASKPDIAIAMNFFIIILLAVHVLNGCSFTQCQGTAKAFCKLECFCISIV
jgi:hypothetical protein